MSLGSFTGTDQIDELSDLRRDNERLRKALQAILGMSSAFEHAVKGQPYTHQSAEFVFKQARAALEP